MSETMNVSIGLLGHVDCGKTSLSKALSMTSSTACFDKNPQSQERGITIDLGFSSFTVSPVPENLSPYKVVQFTLVDCPGHASLIRTIIGGKLVYDMYLSDFSEEELRRPMKLPTYLCHLVMGQKNTFAFSGHSVKILISLKVGSLFPQTSLSKFYCSKNETTKHQVTSLSSVDEYLS